MNFQFSLLQLHTKSLCVLALQNSQFEASTSSRPQTVNFEALGRKAIEMLELGCTFFSVLPHPWGKTEHALSEWGFRNTFVAVTKEVANIFLDAKASLERYL